MSRILALDHGTRRIGVAIADHETGIAFARPAIRRHDERADFAHIARLTAEERITRIVLGLPRNLDGSEGPQAASVRAFAARLAPVVGLPVTFVDERLTSWEAGERLRATGRRPDARSGEVDSASAKLILQEYLDAEEHR